MLWVEELYIFLKKSLYSFVMDDFANEYFKKITKIASDFEGRRKTLAKSRIKMFVASIYRQLVDFNEKYDIVLGAGNSGLFMTKITQMTYKYLNIKTPFILNLPIYRFEEDGKTPSNNSFLAQQVKEKLQNLDSINSILFVDDEIMRALTAKECFNLILQSYPNINRLDTTIIAENHFFEWHYKIPKVSISFFAYSPLIQGLNGNIGYFIPEDLYGDVSSLINGVTSHNHAMAIVIGGALKKKDNNGNPYFDFAVESSLKSKITDYDNKKSSLMNKLQELVRKSVEKYKAGEIKFRF